ncbi:MAG: hypothetical protein ISR72_05315 [Methylobacter sp.]|nr:hypothetical protein [Methylobacter sp.]
MSENRIIDACANGIVGHCRHFFALTKPELFEYAVDKHEQKEIRGKDVL